MGSSEPQVSQKRADVVRQVYAAFIARDEARLRELIAADVIWHTNGADGKGGHGPTMGLEKFLRGAFGYIPNFTSWEIIPIKVLTDGEIVMTRQRDDVVRKDGASASYMFNNYYEFNDRDQIKEVWEVTSSNEPFQ